MKSHSPLARQFLFFVVILALVSQACAISLIEWPTFPTPSGATPLPSGPTATPAPRAEITFTVRLPEPLLPGEELAMTVVDEVTGLAFNSVDYKMQALDATTFSAKLTIPDQAVIRYRYARLIGNTHVFEDTNRDQNIRYRLFYVNGPTQVTDTIGSWTDKAANTISGSISGTVVNADTGAPIPDMLVTAGGVQFLTDSVGRFVLTDLRAGAHNLVVYAIDGMYQTFQQGADVAGNSTTPVQVRVKPMPLVNVTFIASVPPGTVGPNVPIRIAGNLLQLGNTFADLRGGFSSVADRMPVLTPTADGKYSVTISLPAGADVQYKYTMGDGFWNAEFASDQTYVTRRILVPTQNATIEDAVQSWQSGPKAPIVFDVTVPQNTSPSDRIYIQFNFLFGWSQPIPMLNQSQNRWVYKLYGPLNMAGSFAYRYCRNAQCDSADDAQTVGPNSPGRNVAPAIAPQDLIDTVNAWAWALNAESASLVAATIPSRGSEFMAGVEYQSYYDPSTPAFNDLALQNIQSMNANWVVYTPSWTYKRVAPNLFTQQPGKDPFWSDTVRAVTEARARNLNVALFPQPRFETNAADFWNGAARNDINWWNDWFDHYRAFTIHFADLATQSGAQAVIVGGDWILPALPDGKLVDGSPSGVPSDAETRWKNLIAEIRQRFRGKVIFALPYNSTDFTPPVGILRDADAVYLLWFAKLSALATPNKADMINEAGNLLDQNIAPWQLQVGKPFIIGLSYPSATNSATGCIPSGSGACLDWTALNRPNADNSSVSLDLQQQIDIYDAMLNAMNSRSWVNGFVSRGYFAPVELQDKSASVHGKPARDLLWYWFPRLLGTAQ
ncbi:MAG: hypothetical protein IT314_17600 [Anaerolineales bacterium]|nr:hypothetical protein [Anaerolineales bacterium]